MHDPAFIVCRDVVAYAEILNRVPPGQRARLRYVDSAEALRHARAPSVYVDSGWRERTDSVAIAEMMAQRGARVLLVPRHWMPTTEILA